VSRIGKLPIEIPKDVKVTLAGQEVQVDGPKGSLTLQYNDKVKVESESGNVFVRRLGEDKESRAFHGLYQRLISNMVIGVTKGYRKELEIVGVGYRAQLESAKDGDLLVMQLGLSHQIRYPVPAGIKITVPKPTRVVIEGIDKQKVGQVAAELRHFRPPEPYKGKGVRYLGEHVRRKVGKAGPK